MYSGKFIRDETFRLPLPFETALGLWVDRIGEYVQIPASLYEASYQFRMLGMYAVNALTAGHGTFESVIQKETAVGPGDVWLSLPRDPNRYRPNPGTRWDNCWIIWQGPLADALFKTGFPAAKPLVIHNAAHVVRAAYDEMRALMRQEEEEAMRARIGQKAAVERRPLMRQETPAAALRRQLIVQRMLLELHDIAQATLSGDSPERLAQRLVDWLSTPTGLRESVNDAASHFNVNPSTLRHACNQYTGHSPKLLQTKLRLAQAKDWLIAGRSIKEVAVDLGFTDEFHFMRVFKAHTGQTAAQFRAGQIVVGQRETN